MQHTNQPLENKPVQSLVKPKKHISLLLIHVIAVSLLIVVSAGITYWWRDDIANKAETKLQTQISNMQKITVDVANETTDSGEIVIDQSSECSPISASPSGLETIKETITTGNTQPLEGYMADTVNVILAATEAYGAQPKTQAVASITSFIGNSASTTWDFNLGASVISSYGSGGYSQYFPNIALVGKSSSDKVISFLFNCDGKISTVFLANAEELLQ